MTANDIKTGQELLKEDFIQSNPAWAKVRARGCAQHDDAWL